MNLLWLTHRFAFGSVQAGNDIQIEQLMCPAKIKK
jgi:hypothetical protein